MKKLLALILSLSLMTVCAVGCGDKDKSDKEDTKSSSVSEKEDDDDDEEETTEEDEEEETTEEEEEPTEEDTDSDEPADVEIDPDDITNVEAGQLDSALVGNWYSDEMGFSFCFGDDGIMGISMDYSSIMYFDETQNLVMSGVEVPSEYDGEVLSVNIEGATAEESMFVMEMKRTGAADTSTIDGEYILTGGMLYDELSAMFSDGVTGAETTITLDGTEFIIEYDMCEYAADGKNIEIFATESPLFEDMGDDAAVCGYTIFNDTLTMTDTSGEVIELLRN